METKLRCKIGNVEIEYEGSTSFLKDDIPNVIQKMLESLKQHTDIEAVNRENPGTPKISEHSTNTIAGHLPTQTGPDLVIAACAYFTFSKRLDVCSRQDILTEMKEATTYYKDSYSANLSKSLDTLVKTKRLNLRSRNNYVLSPTERQKLGELLAHHQ
jgi:hypothetical protein